MKLSNFKGSSFRLSQAVTKRQFSSILINQYASRTCFSECAVSFTKPTEVPPAYEDVYVQEGRDARLVWTYSVTNRNELDLNRAIRWATYIPQLTLGGVNRKGLIIEKRDRTRLSLPSIPSYLTGRVSIEDPATLVINNVKTTDDNFYECQLATTALTFVSRLIKLTVISK